MKPAFERGGPFHPRKTGGLKPQRCLVSLFLLLAPLSFLMSGSAAPAAEKSVHVLLAGAPITPAAARFIAHALEKAPSEGAACCVIQLDTPGGLVESTRDIVKSIHASEVPVVVYVAPSGARAASAGVMITMSADIAAMAPGTNIGAAHPVGGGGEDVGEAMGEKVLNDTVAFARAIAEKRGRNGKWAERAVRESVSITDAEAVKEKVVDLVARDMDELLEKIDGREIPGKGVLRTKGLAVKIVEESVTDSVLKTLADPNIAYILMMIGLAGLYAEFSHPGAIVPGTIGAISLILAFYSFQALPVRATGVILILLAVILFIMETQVASHGILGTGGVIALVLGSLMLFDEEKSGTEISLKVMLPMALGVSAFFAGVTTLVVKSQVRRAMTGADGLVGKEGVVRRAIAPGADGKVLVHGEIWRASAAEQCEEGDRVRVSAVSGLRVMVEKV
jgi:membrane-bound serine protease (ClpP class)